MRKQAIKHSVRPMEKAARSPGRASTVRPSEVYDAYGVNRRIAALCEGKSLSELGAITGFSHETARRVISGVTAPSARFIVELCCAFQVSADWILLGKGNQSQAARHQNRRPMSPSMKAHRPQGTGRARRRLPSS